ncbi:MAG: hypothetical protein LBJ18_03375 [Rickettsiales bacterium]|jgi:hypothetical protein|nr:hypothetical protein [Rickettsiales bacterium]
MMHKNCPRTEFGAKNLATFFNVNTCAGCNKTIPEVNSCWPGVRELLVSKYHLYHSILIDEPRYDFNGAIIIMDKAVAKQKQDEVLGWHATAEAKCNEIMTARTK